MTKHATPRQKELGRRRQRRYYQRQRKRTINWKKMVTSAEEYLARQPLLQDTRSVWDILDRKPKKMEVLKDDNIKNKQGENE